jgi:hypothetical protein
MQRPVAILLIILVSYAFSYETIKHFSKSLESDAIEIADGWNASEKSQENKAGDEKKDAKKDFNEYLSLYKPLRLMVGHCHAIAQASNTKEDTADFSQLVYSPPEFFVA